MKSRMMSMVYVGLVLTLGAVRAHAAKKDCDPALGSTPASVTHHGWEDSALSDPRQHLDGHPFQYLVHALASENTRMLQMLESLKFAEKEARSLRRFIDLERTPERVAERQFVSTSLISETMLATWADAGLILRPHRSNIVAMSTQDLGAVHGIGVHHEGDALEAYVAKRAAEHPVISASELLNWSSPSSYNEVLLRGTSAGGDQLVLEGFFVIVDEMGGSKVTRDMSRAIQVAAKRLGLPIVRLTRVRDGYVSEPIQIQNHPLAARAEYVTWQNQGVRHLLRLSPNKFFETDYVGQYSAYRFMGEQTVDDEANLRKFAAALLEEIPRNVTLATALRGAGLEITPSGWRTPGGQPPIKPRPPARKAALDLDAKGYSSSKFVRD